MINGVTKIVMTKADVLDAFQELAVCTAYKINGKETREIPFQMDRAVPEPIYKNFKGWHTDISAMRQYGELPNLTLQYISFINEYLGVTIGYISNGPGRDQIIEVN
jgi:adenylosuccinate synthase